MQIAFKGTLLGIFIYKEQLVISSCIANQFYLDKIKPDKESKLELLRATNSKAKNN
jgi:hypothetical protein